jgi:isocitrate dehydrogenase
MFEAIHGSAPPIAGKGIANPSGLLLGAVMMLVHIQQNEVASRVHNAWLRTIEDGIHTVDIFREGTSRKNVGTREFSEAVIARLGQLPERFKPVSYEPKTIQRPRDQRFTRRPTSRKELVGVDVFLDWDREARDVNALARKLNEAGAGASLKLLMITNRGVGVWPKGMPETFCSDHWRCRYMSDETADPVIAHSEIVDLLQRLSAAGFDFIKTENLYNFDGKPGYSLGQGE